MWWQLTIAIGYTYIAHLINSDKELKDASESMECNHALLSIFWLPYLLTIALLTPIAYLLALLFSEK